MNIRQEVETAVTTFAAAQTPPVAVAYEGVPFTKPKNLPYIEIVFLNNTITNATVDATRARVYGTVQINVSVPDGKGMKQLDDLTSGIADLFPVADKERFSTFSVEQPPNVSASMMDIQYRWAAVRIKYRQEL
jgi:hypothetical protein